MAVVGAEGKQWTAEPTVGEECGVKPRRGWGTPESTGEEALPELWDSAAAALSRGATDLPSY